MISFISKGKHRLISILKNTSRSILKGVFLYIQKNTEDMYAVAMKTEFNSIVKKILVPLMTDVPFNQEMEDTIRKVSKDGIPLYVLRNSSDVNFLYLNIAFLARKIPLTVLSNGTSSWQFSTLNEITKHLIVRYVKWLGLVENLDPFSSSYVNEILSKEQNILIFLKQARRFRDLLKQTDDSERIISEVITAQKNIDKPIYIIPLSIVWKKKFDHEPEYFWDIFFKSQDNPVFISRWLRFFLYRQKAFVLVGEPLNLKKFISQESAFHKDEKLATILRRMLLGYFYREKRVYQGPNIQSRSVILKWVLQDRELQSNLSLMAEKQNIKLEELEKSAKNYLINISADISMSMIDIADHVLNYAWNTMYEHIFIDKEEINILKEHAKHSTLVLIPCHRSHVDYLLLSYVLHNNNMVVPHIAAGMNLMFWPLGNIFRSMGAFFVQRSFENDSMKLMLFKKYFWRLLQEGHTIEFFMEGGRSRTGKYLYPKTGMLSMVMDFVEANAQKFPISIVPVMIHYDYVPESNTYIKELQGLEKKKENIFQLISSVKVLKQKYGKAYLGFLQPIPLNDFLEKNNIALSEYSNNNNKEKNVKELALEIMKQIAKRSPLTAIECASASLLLRTDKVISASLFYEQSFIIYQTCLESNKNIAFDFSSQALLDAYKTLLKHSQYSGLINNNLKNDQIEVPKNLRLNLAYHKNSILVSIIEPVLIAYVVIHSSKLKNHNFYTTEDSMKNLLKRMINIWEFEFLLSSKNENDILSKGLNTLIKLGYIKHDEMQKSGFVLKDLTALNSLALLLAPFWESYCIVLETILEHSDNLLSTKQIEKLCIEALRMAYKQKRIDYYESINISNISNAIFVFKNLGILKQVETDSLEKKDKKLKKELQFSLNINKAKELHNYMKKQGLFRL